MKDIEIIKKDLEKTYKKYKDINLNDKHIKVLIDYIKDLEYKKGLLIGLRYGLACAIQDLNKNNIEDFKNKFKESYNLLKNM